MAELNPYEPPQELPEPSISERQKRGEEALYFAAQAQNIVGGFGLLFGIFGSVFWLLILLGMNPYHPSSVQSDQLAPRVFATSLLMVIQCTLMVAGGVSMHRHKHRWLALVGAWAGISPICGCYVLSLLCGIWTLIVLRRPEVRELFAARTPAGT